MLETLELKWLYNRALNMGDFMFLLQDIYSNFLNTSLCFTSMAPSPDTSDKAVCHLWLPV